MPEQTNPQQGIQKRQIAYKLRIKEIIEGKYVKEEGWNPNYVETSDGRRISRISLISTVVQKSEEGSSPKSAVLDDGSSRISARSFENTKIFDDISVGDAVLVVGKPREFGNEKYLLAEIAKKINPLWIKVRKLELGDMPNSISAGKNNDFDEKNTRQKKNKVNITEEICGIVKLLDEGGGADIEEVISASKIADAERIIRSLLEGGELFEIRAGKLKVLE